MTTFPTTRVETLDPVTGLRRPLCRGPRPDGACSAPVTSGALGCSGGVIVVELAGLHQRIRLLVSAGLDRCPLAPLAHPWVG